jgi:hypothetical protein
VAGDQKNLSGFQGQVLNAARRHAERVAEDNKAFKNYQNRMKGGAGGKISAASKFFSRVNSPISSMPSMARPGDNSIYSGIGGQLGSLGAAGSRGSLGENGEEKTEQGHKTVEGKGGQGGNMFGGAESGSGLGLDNDSNMFNQYSDYGSDPSSVSAEQTMPDSLKDAAAITGMKEGDVKNMLESAERDRDKGLSASADDTIFKIISKAYYRNLDRVLIRKQAPRTAPVKEQEGQGNSEKEQIKKLFR